MRVQILHNQNERESFLRGYQQGDPLLRVYDGEPKGLRDQDNLEYNLEFIYRQNQHGVPGSYPWYQDARSLSVGDVIVIGTRAFAVANLGFTELENFEVPA